MSIDLDPSRLRPFVAVAEALHFTRAAERLNIAQPALSRLIGRLERDLGVRLFERTRRSVQLTDAGRVLLGHARAMIESSTAARRDVERAARGEIGRIVVGFVPTVGGVLPEAIRAFQARFPDVVVELREVRTTTEHLELLLRDGIQVGLSHYPAGATPGTRSVVIRTERYSVVAVPADHRLAARRSVDLSDLWGERLITAAAASPYFDELVAAAEAAGAAPEILQMSDQTTRLVLVAAGVGVTLLLGSAPRIDHPSIVYRPLTGSTMTVDLYATRRSDQREPHVDAFLEMLRAPTRERRAPRPKAARRS